MLPQALMMAIPLLAGLFGGRSNSSGGSNSTAPSTQTTDPMLQEFMRMQQGRMNYEQPLYEAIMQMAMGLLPTNRQRPMGPFEMPPGTGGSGSGGGGSHYSAPPPPSQQPSPDQPLPGDQNPTPRLPEAARAAPSGMTDVDYLRRLTG